MKQLCLIIIFFLGSLFSQEQAILIFVHGLGSNANDWDEFEMNEFGRQTGLVNPNAQWDTRYQIAVSYDTEENFTLADATDSFKEDMDFMNSNNAFFPSPTVNYVFVCHSLGGLVVKNYLRLHPNEQARTKAVYTLGTPHRGAPVAERSKEEFFDIISTKFIEIGEAEAARKAGGFLYGIGSTLSDLYSWMANVLFDVVSVFTGEDYPHVSFTDIVSGYLAWDSFNNNGNIPDINSNIVQALKPSSSDLAVLRAYNFGDIDQFSITGAENGPVLYRAEGSLANLRDRKSTLMDELHTINAYNERDTRDGRWKRMHLFKARGDRWYNFSKGTYRAGYRAMRDIDGSFSTALKSYVIEGRSGERWVPCDNYYDDEFGDETAFKQNIFGQVTGYGTCPGWYENFYYSLTISEAHDGLVPSYYAKHSNAEDSYYEAVGHNHSQLQMRIGFYARAGQSSEQFQDNLSWERLRDRVLDEEFGN